MREGELFGVEEVAFEISNLRAQSWVLNGVVAPPAVGFITDNRVLYPREMDANLMGPAGF
jgi:hypothetical protein